MLSGPRALVRIQAYNLLSGGTPNTFQSSRYTLLVDGKPAATADAPVGKSKVDFDVDLSGIQAGWRRLDIEGLSGGETCPTWWAFVKRGAVTAQDFTPVVRGTYELVQRNESTNIWAKAPGSYKPTLRPLTVKRDYTPFATALPRSELHCTQLVPLRFGDVHRPSLNADGVLSSFDLQPYFWTDFFAAKPRLALLDGPRGVGTVCMVTHISIGTAAPANTGPRNNTYFCDPWRVGKVSVDGTVTTLVGYRHKGVMSYWQDPADVELVGDWSAVPVGRRGFHELWGMAWDDRTLIIDESAAPIPAELNQQPHVVGPTMFLADSQNDRIVKVVFSATAHGVPPKVTEFVTGIKDPWDVVYSAGLIYVTERQSHRITAYDATTGTLVRVLVQGLPLASIDQNREVVRALPIAALQLQDCVAPEGLYLLDGWLYFASKAQGQVRRINLLSNELQVVCGVPMDDNSKFCKLAIGDGTFGPRGTVFTWTFSNAQMGHPATRLPNGTLWTWYEQIGGTGNFGQFVYPTAGAVGQGRLISGGVNEGLLMITRKQAGDVALSAAVTRGVNQYHARGLHLLHGHNGFGFYGLPLPWGVSADIDAYLDSFGHPRTAQAAAVKKRPLAAT